MRLIPTVILCALLGIVYWVGATHFTDHIQNDITERSSAAISTFKPDVNLAVDGRDVTLTGLVNSEQQKQQAKQLVDSVWGVRASRNMLDVRDGYAFRASHTEADGMVMSGTVDSEAAVDSMTSAIAPVVPKGSVGTRSRPMVNSGEKLALGAGALLMLNEGELSIDEQLLHLAGNAEDDIIKNQIESKLREHQALIDPLQVVTDIGIVNTMTQACRTMLSAIVDSDSVLFEVDSFVINDRYTAVLATYRDLLNVCPGILLIEAHADQDGSEAYNKALSENRAEAVAQYLIAQGIASERVQTFSYGETRPIASNESRHDKSYNRRVDLEYVNTRSADQISTQQPIISSLSPE